MIHTCFRSGASSYIPYILLIFGDHTIKECCINTPNFFTGDLWKDNITRCYHCNRSYKRKSSLRRHLRYECGKAATLPCRHCSKKFKRHDKLLAHIKMNHFVTNSMVPTNIFFCYDSLLKKNIVNSLLYIFSNYMYTFQTNAEFISATLVVDDTKT